MDDTKNYLTAEIQNLENTLSENKKLLETEADSELKNLISEDIKALEAQKISLEQSLAAMDGNFASGNDKAGGPDINPNTAVLEIRAGTGGDEAGLFANDLYQMYLGYGEKNNWKFTQIFSSLSEMGGIKTMVTEIRGLGAFNKLKHESGVHRVQRIPQTESGGRIHTSTSTVAVLPELKKVELEIKPDDLKWEFFRAGGHGGQNVNKVSTAVRLIHLPTQTIIECQEERSQGKNRDKALGILHSKLYTIMQEQHVKSVSDIRTAQVGTGDRSEKIRTYNFPQDRVTDHRINKSWHNIALVMNGELDDVFSDLKALDDVQDAEQATV